MSRDMREATPLELARELLSGGIKAPTIAPKAHAVSITAGWQRFLPHQWDYYKYLPKGRVATQAILGGWGSGKTHGNMRKAARMAMLNPWRPAYGNSNPVGILAAPTHRILRQSLMAHFDRLIPREMVLKRRGPPYNDILLSNGFRWVLHSGESDIEGLDAAVVVITEIHHNSWASDPVKFLNLKARLRDPHALYMGMFVDGLPESGWVRDTFDFSHRPSPNNDTILCATAGNPYIPRDTLQAFYESCPSGQERKLLGGQWMPPQGAIYPQFSADLHLVDNVGQEGVPTHASFDVGNFGCVLLGQDVLVETKGITGHVVDRAAPGLLIHDQILTSDLSVDAMCYKLKTETPWLFTEASVFTVDPTIRRDELAAMRMHFPQVRIVKRDKSHAMFPIEAGIRVVQRALLDALGNTRLYFSRHLASVPLGIIDGIQRYRRNETTQEAIKDNSRDHPLDCLRYLCCEKLQPSRPETVEYGR